MDTESVMKQLKAMEATIEKLTGNHHHAKASALTNLVPYQLRRMYENCRISMDITLTNVFTKRYVPGPKLLPFINDHAVNTTRWWIFSQTPQTHMFNS